MGGHQSATMISDTWLTPPSLLAALGPFDLDPACPENMPWRTAARMLTKNDDGLAAPWAGRVWLNPPYSREAVRWLRRLSDHGDGVALIFARTETAWFFETVWRSPSVAGVLFLEGRLHFHHLSGERASASAGAPSALIAYGRRNAAALVDSGIAGCFLPLGQHP